MKKVSLVVAASFSLLSFGAFAGGNCLYGHGDELAKVEENTIVEEEVDPALLALLKKQKLQAEQVKPIIAFN